VYCQKDAGKDQTIFEVYHNRRLVLAVNLNQQI